MRFTDSDKEKKLNQLQATIKSLVESGEIPSKQERIATLAAQSADATFWDDPDEARKTMQELESLRDAVAALKQLEQSLEDIDVLLEMSKDEDGEDAAQAIEDEAEEILSELERHVQRMETARLFDGEHDRCAVLMEINSGAGGTEAQDWTEMLLRMYVRWAEQNGCKVEFLSELRGEEAGLKNVSIRISGERAYGHLRGENGVHRLVRISPFDSNARRHTSFASVFSMPELEDTEAIEVLDKDLRIDTFRASGAGGQHINKTDSAIRITHLPTGIVVSCQNDRSQHKNKATALKLLKAKLYELQQRQKEEELSAVNATKQDIAWGSQIRSYVLHPYRMVKDHRTGFEVGDADKVLDGNLAPFIESYLRSKATKS